MTFANTGDRVPIENLANTSDTGRYKYEQVKKYLADGHTQEEAAVQFGYANKSSISRLLKKFDNNDVAQSLHEATESNSTK
jgi:hypothetical protein